MEGVTDCQLWLLGMIVDGATWDLGGQVGGGFDDRDARTDDGDARPDDRDARTLTTIAARLTDTARGSTTVLLFIAPSNTSFTRVQQVSWPFIKS